MSGAGDVDSDGFADVIVGASGDDNNGASSGSARVFAGGPSDPIDLILFLGLTVADMNLQQGIDNNLDSKLGAALNA